jgi:hypothetical protein
MWNEWIPLPISKSITGFINEIAHAIAAIGFFVLMSCVYFIVFMFAIRPFFGIFDPKHNLNKLKYGAS